MIVNEYAKIDCYESEIKNYEGRTVNHITIYPNQKGFESLVNLRNLPYYPFDQYRVEDFVFIRIITTKRNQSVDYTLPGRAVDRRLWIRYEDEKEPYLHWCEWCKDFYYEKDTQYLGMRNINALVKILGVKECDILTEMYNKYCTTVCNGCYKQYKKHINKLLTVSENIFLTEQLEKEIKNVKRQHSKDHRTVSQIST